MRTFLLLCVAACGGATVRPATEPVATTSSQPVHSCTDAAVGIDRATKGVRPPDSSVFDSMRARCEDDRWPVAAVECFATMKEGEVGSCARELHDGVRDNRFAVLAGGSADRGSLEVARARLDAMALPIAECDRFVKGVSAVLACEQMPLETRIALGNDTADFWQLPEVLPADAQQRIASACVQSLTALQQHATSAGCMM